MNDIHICSNVTDFIKNMKDFKNKNPNCFFRIKDKPKQLLHGFEAILDDGSAVEWYLPFLKFKEYNTHFTDNNLEVIRNFLKLSIELIEAQSKYVELFTGQK